MNDFILNDGDMQKKITNKALFRTDEDKDDVCAEYGERQLVKNKITFSYLFGNWYKAFAKDLWPVLEQGTKDHLKDFGIHGYEDFLMHMKETQRWMDEDLFPEYFKFGINQWNSFVENGQIRYPTGYLYNGIKRKNQVVNAPIQGSFSQIISYSIIKTNKWLKDNNKKSKIVNQIHDSIVFLMHKDELEEVLYKLKHFISVEIPSEWGFINMPLDIDAEIYYENGRWTEVERKGYFDNDKLIIKDK